MLDVFGFVWIWAHPKTLNMEVELYNVIQHIESGLRTMVIETAMCDPGTRDIEGHSEGQGTFRA